MIAGRARIVIKILLSSHRIAVFYHGFNHKEYLKLKLGFTVEQSTRVSADKLKDGDITDTKLREIVVTEPLDGTERHDVNFKLDALSQFKHRNRISCQMT